MKPFVRKVQPSRFEAWTEGRDFALHPEDPWYVRRCLQDAITRLFREEISMKEFERLKKELKRKRQIPLWFKERFILDYDDQIVLNPATGLKSREGDKEESERVRMERPRVRQARLCLMERIGLGSGCCKVSRSISIIDHQNHLQVGVKKLNHDLVSIYKAELDAHKQMLAEEDSRLQEPREEILKKIESGGAGKGAAKGVGFAGVTDAELLEQRAKVTCKAKKQHRFVHLILIRVIVNLPIQVQRLQKVFRMSNGELWRVRSLPRHASVWGTQRCQAEVRQEDLCCSTAADLSSLCLECWSLKHPTLVLSMLKFR